MHNSIKSLIIAVDGYSSCGKSTLAKDLAVKLDYTYIDSGAMYRAVTLFCLRNNIIKDDSIDTHKLGSVIDNINIAFRHNKKNGKPNTYLNDENVEEEIRNNSMVSDHVSPVSKLAIVREKLVRLQRDLGKDKRIVMDGRDIGTVVFPDADLKIFMTAGVDIRAQRRYKELTDKNISVTIEDVKSNISKRDFIDENRDISPLKKADDAVILDNSYLSREEQLQWALKKINEITQC